MAAGAMAAGVSLRKAPSAVATPLPPLKRRNTGQQLPTMASSAPAASHTGSGPIISATRTATYPFTTSPSNVNTAGTGPRVRSTLVAPIVPLPLPRMSMPPAARATKKPTGMAPMR